MSALCPGCPPSPHALLAESAQHLGNVSRRIGIISGIDNKLARVVAGKVRGLSQRQAELSGALAYHNKQGQLGLITALAIGGGLLLSTVAGLIWKQREETKELDKQTSFYEQLVAGGMDTETAAKLAMGQYSKFNDVVKGIAVLAGLGLAVYLIMKLK